MGVHSHFHVQPNYSVEVVLFCVVVGVVTISLFENGMLRTLDGRQN